MVTTHDPWTGGATSAAETQHVAMAPTEGPAFGVDTCERGQRSAGISGLTSAQAAPARDR